MPEGDTIHRAAAALRIALVGQPMVRFEAPRLIGPLPEPGRVIETVDSHGKHLEIAWDDGLVLHTHMRMTGSWHLYRPGDSWRRPYHQMRATIEVRGLGGGVLQRAARRDVPAARPAPAPGHGTLGPDLCKADADLGEVVNARLSLRGPGRRRSTTSCSTSGSCAASATSTSAEVLWACRARARSPARHAERARAIRLVNDRGHACSGRTSTAGRVTAPGVKGGLAVYGRNGQPCHRCGEPIGCGRLGEHARTTYWCPGCQPGETSRPVRPAVERRHPDGSAPGRQRWLADLPGTATSADLARAAVLDPEDELAARSTCLDDHSFVVAPPVVRRLGAEHVTRYSPSPTPLGTSSASVTQSCRGRRPTAVTVARAAISAGSGAAQGGDHVDRPRSCRST